MRARPDNKELPLRIERGYVSFHVCLPFIFFLHSVYPLADCSSNVGRNFKFYEILGSDRNQIMWRLVPNFLIKSEKLTLSLVWPDLGMFRLFDCSTEKGLQI